MKTKLLKQEDIYSGHLILVNREYGHRKQSQDLICVGMWENDEILYDRVAKEALDNLMEEIGGWEWIVPVSAWRSLEEQQKIWNESLAENGLEFTENYVAVPGHSEHQTGLAIDLALKQSEIDFIRPYFPYEGICQKFRDRAAGYGFIQRYQEGKQSVTQIGHEPWHFRYVGTPHAEIMVQLGLALEEYIAFLKDYSYRENPFLFQTKPKAGGVASDNITYRISYVRSTGKVTEIPVDEIQPYRISGNNCDGFVVTEVLVNVKDAVFH